MHDTLGFLQQQPAAREGCLDGLTFSMMYRANENYV